MRTIVAVASASRSVAKNGWEVAWCSDRRTTTTIAMKNPDKIPVPGFQIATANGLAATTTGSATYVGVSAVVAEEEVEAEPVDQLVVPLTGPRQAEVLQARVDDATDSLKDLCL